MTDTKAPIHLAVDLGASGGRVLAGSITDDGVKLDAVHRFANGGYHVGDRLCWNIVGQWAEVQTGLATAAQRFGDAIRSVGADTWGVDYVLLDRQNDLVGTCVHYRDARTRGLVEKSASLISRDDMFAATGLQFMEINTAYQLLAMREERSPLLDVAERFLMVPDFMHWQMSGEQVNEFTNASTTQLLDAQTGDWSKPVLEALDIPPHLFTTPVQPGQSLGNVRQAVRDATQLHSDVQVIVPATHDTGSAVLAVPADSFAQEKPDWCYISCGTWSLMGVEISAPVLTPECQMFNFTNEGGVRGSIRLLKNISGLWIVQQCREQWKREGHDWSWDRMVQMAEAAEPMMSIIDPDDPSFVAPSSMPEAVRDYCKRTGQVVPADEGAVIRCALESLALRYRMVLGYLEQLVGSRFNTIHMVGGGVQNRMLCQFAADACQRRVVAGPIEATAMGNVLMQAIGTGAIDSIDQARELVGKASDIFHYEPRPVGRWDEGFAKLQQLSLSSNHGD
ncbi:MAG: rhamnulokinase family protein [Aureliella sp.]